MCVVCRSIKVSIDSSICKSPVEKGGKRFSCPKCSRNNSLPSCWECLCNKTRYLEVLYNAVVFTWKKYFQFPTAVMCFESVSGQGQYFIEVVSHDLLRYWKADTSLLRKSS